MKQLRGLAQSEDRPISELVRLAVERLLQQKPPLQTPPKAFPTFRGGKILIPSEHLKEEIYRDDE